jgi:hypothetical protein
MHRKAINRDARHYDLCTASPFASDCPLVTEFSSFSTIAIRYCVHCGVDYSREQLVKLAKAGRVAAQTPEAQARRAETKRRHDLVLKDWSASSQPDWLTDEFYAQKIQPKLAEITVRALASAIDVSLPYATAFFPLAAVGTFSFDGKGMASRSYTVSFGGLVFPNHDSGPYTVNSDCTASATFSDATWSMVILGHGREIKAMNASPGVVVQGVLNRQ